MKFAWVIFFSKYSRLFDFPFYILPFNSLEQDVEADEDVQLLLLFTIIFYYDDYGYLAFLLRRFTDILSFFFLKFFC